MTTIRPSEGFTVSELLNKDGFTLDTGIFADILDDCDSEEDVEYERCKLLSNQEMLKYLYLEDSENENRDNKEEHTVNSVVTSFSELKPKMHNIYEDGKVLKQIKKEGSGHIVPKNAIVKVIYTGYFEYKDEPFDTTYYHKNKETTLYLGRGDVIPGLEIAISSMKKFEKALFIIQPDLAYGELGCEPRIPPNAEVLFSVELVNYVDDGSADMFDELNNEDKKRLPAIEKTVLNLVNSANENFKMQKYKQAIRYYSRAIKYLESASLENDTEEERMKKLLDRALKNLTNCYNKINKPKLACDCFNRMHNRDEKAYFHNGVALYTLGEYDEAIKSLKEARRIKPNHPDIDGKIKEIEERRRKHLEFFARLKNSSKSENKNDEFKSTASEMCDYFLEDTKTLKQSLPMGLSSDEMDCFKRVAAKRGLYLTTLTRYDVDTHFLTKKSYYSKDYY